MLDTRPAEKAAISKVTVPVHRTESKATLSLRNRAIILEHPIKKTHVYLSLSSLEHSWKNYVLSLLSFQDWGRIGFLLYPFYKRISSRQWPLYKSWYTIARLTTIGMFVRKGNGDGETLDNRDPIQTFDSVLPTIILRCTLNFIRVFGIITWNNTANIYYRFCNLL